jgi:hypothetical protein
MSINRVIACPTSCTTYSLAPLLPLPLRHLCAGQPRRSTGRIGWASTEACGTRYRDGPDRMSHGAAGPSRRTDDADRREWTWRPLEQQPMLQAAAAAQQDPTLGLSRRLGSQGPSKTSIG